MAELEEFGAQLARLRRGLGRLEREASGGCCGPRGRALRALWRQRAHERPVEMGALVEELAIDQSNVSRLCKRLERDGDLERRVCPRDRRVRRLCLTDQGAERAHQLVREERARLAELLEQMSEVERLHVAAALRLLERSIEASASSTCPAGEESLG